MATKLHNLSSPESGGLPSTAGMRFGIAVAQWNAQITGKLLEGALDVLRSHGVDDNDIVVEKVPGSFELTFAANQMAKHSGVDAIIVLGSVVRGDTPHFDYVCQGVTQGIAELNAKGDVPVIFGLLTTDDMLQAMQRAGGELGNKGAECAMSAIKMADFVLRLRK